MSILIPTLDEALTPGSLDKSAAVVEVKSCGTGATTPEPAILAQSNSAQVSSASFLKDYSSSADFEDPACIVGIACRLPGGVKSPSDLWKILVEKKTTQCQVPAERFNIDGFYQENSSRAGVMNASGGYFLQEDVRQFDNAFFGINNLEATYMDPQQRKLLEVTYECLEDAGLSLDEVSGSNTAVYVGNFTVDYLTMQTRDPDALHPLKLGDCEAAIVAGANLITSCEQHLGTMKGGVLSATSACHTFDASADGYGRAEAVDVIYVKRLSAALRDGDSVRAVIRSTAINSNGKTPGITQPSAKLQEAVIRKAYADAGLRFEDTDYVECHGTGTAVGDPIEVEAIGRCFSPREGPPLLIGAVKTNIGHSEAASGLSAVIKATLAFENGKIPPTYGLTKLNPKLNLDVLNLKVATEVEEWPRSLRRASINSFGYGGANAHCILESIDSYLGRDQGMEPPEHEHEPRLSVIPVSAKTKQSLQERVRQMSDLAGKCTKTKLRNLVHTLSQRRSDLTCKAFLLVSEGSVDSGDWTAIDVPTASKPLPFAFVFTGQGAQYAGMAKELLLESAVFRDCIRKLDSILRGLPSDQAPSWSLEQTIIDPPMTSQINDVTRSQPICTAVQVALIDVLRSWGINADAVVGHSSGEIAAAYAADQLSASQAILVAYFRGFAVGKIQSQGGMMAAGISATTAKELLLDLGLRDEVVVACVNAPSSVTLSGTNDGITKVMEELQSQGKFARKLVTGGRAYHSPMMAEIGQLYEDLVAPVLDQEVLLRTDLSHVKMYSSVGQDAEKLAIFEHSPPNGPQTNARYWRENLENPVQFDAALTKLTASGKFHVVEIGPHSALKGPIEQIRKANKAEFQYIPTLLRGEDSDRCIKKLAGSLFLYGHSLDWSVVNSQLNDAPLEALHDLPPYPWDHSGQLLWSESRASVEMRNRRFVRHELLGTEQLAGNEIDWSWRNVLRLEEIPWIKDHKLEQQVVFPATGYLAAALEAICRMNGITSPLGIEFEFRNVNISAALVLPEDAGTDAIELHTTMSKRKLSTANNSETWHDFSISSWEKGQSRMHCSGSLRSHSSSAESLAGIVNVRDTESYDIWGMRPWYKKLSEEGLCFGPEFQSLTDLSTDSSRVRPEAVSTTKLIQQMVLPAGKGEFGAYYPVHPVAIDACLQAAIMGGTAGNLNTLRAYLPVFIGSCRIRTPNPSSVGQAAKIHTRSRSTGFATKQIACTLRDVSGAPIIYMNQVRLSLYTGKSAAVEQPSANATGLSREPCLRVCWKPDVSRLSSATEASLRSYVAGVVRSLPANIADHEAMGAIWALMDLASFKNPRMRVLELGARCECRAKEWIEALNNETTYTRCRSWSSCTLGSDSKITIQDGSSGPFDVLLFPELCVSAAFWEKGADQINSLLSPEGIIITRSIPSVSTILKEAGFSTLEVGKGVSLAIRPPRIAELAERNAFIVVRNDKLGPFTETLVQAISTYLGKTLGLGQVQTLPLNAIATHEVTDKDLYISMLEIEREFLATMSTDEMNLLRRITDVTTDLLWLTTANMLSDPQPSLTLSSGLSRALMLEQPSLSFTVLDIGDANTSKASIEQLCTNLAFSILPQNDMDDKEFVQSDGLLHISRFVPDKDINSLFRRRMNVGETVVTKPLKDIGRASLSIGSVGQTDTIHFQQQSEPITAPPSGFVDIQLKAVSLNAKDIYTMTGRVETRTGTAALEFSGIVRAVGSDVDHLKVGDHAVVLAPNHFSTIERVPSWAAHKMLPGEDFTVMPTLPVAYGTALYALHDRAHLRAGESILVHSGAGAFGMATIALAQRLGAVVYTTVGSLAKKEFLIHELGLQASHIFNSRDSSFVAGIRAATNGKGVDVVINSLVGDLMHDTWDCIADFGRFVEVGKRELVDAGKLDMRIFLRNCTFTAFDLTELFFHPDQFYRDIWINKTKEALELYRSKEIKAVPITTFDVSSIPQAYRQFSNKDRIGKIVISMEDQNSLVPVLPSKYLTLFSSDKVYLLVGCLGGLGRSLSRWMMARGARNFVFLGRSGCDKPEAQSLVSRLRSAGANVHVVRGDVVKASAVDEAVQTCLNTGLLIGGIVQAAMGLSEALFCRMTNEAWHTSIQPKWTGTWNLHNAVKGHDESMDFFLLTSSVSGSVGTATESNYCSANGFLDSFARWRRAQGKPAVAVGLGMISEVGYLHENPDIEALLLRKGIQPLNEDEFLQVVDLALAGIEVGGVNDNSSPASAHVLTGLEPFGILDLMSKGFDVDNGTMQDPRTALLAAALKASQDQDASGTDAGNAVASLSSVSWSKDIPSNVMAVFAPEAGASSLQEAVLRIVRKRFSSLILMPLDQIDDHKPLAQFGVDSMIAAEYRTWFWNTFKVDVPFLDLMSPQKSLDVQAAFVSQVLRAASQKK
ncbi:hypothetical protein DL764_007495 [Monosporascus ibericus]|uniref:Uncharacterized protein n=1 Tax=Monosporascus ibericus TaxID=155417 RepID=A0A4Q4T2F0_9PEZI|nr:hypothetical protein DL764_007495 [Monosporascus ibericus]